MNTDTKVNAETFLLAACMDYEPIFKEYIPRLKGYTWIEPVSRLAFEMMEHAYTHGETAGDLFGSPEPPEMLAICEHLGETADNILGMNARMLTSLCEAALLALREDPATRTDQAPAMIQGKRTIEFWCKLSADIRERKGFVTTRENTLEKLMLCVSELSEAAECVRNGEWDTTIGPTGKPEGFTVELADLCIRVFDICGSFGIDLEEAIAQKSRYNETRPYRHNKVNPGGA